MYKLIGLQLPARLLIVAGCLSGCAFNNPCRSGSCADDAEITASVQSAIDRYAQLGPDHVDVQTLGREGYLDCY